MQEFLGIYNYIQYIAREILMVDVGFSGKYSMGSDADG